MNECVMNQSSQRWPDSNPRVSSPWPSLLPGHQQQCTQHLNIRGLGKWAAISWLCSPTPVISKPLICDVLLERKSNVETSPSPNQKHVPTVEGSQLFVGVSHTTLKKQVLPAQGTPRFYMEPSLETVVLSRLASPNPMSLGNPLSHNCLGWEMENSR